MSEIFEEVELLTITYKSDHIINQSLSQISEKYKVTVVENSNDVNFKQKIQNRKNINCILSGKNLGFGTAFNLGAKSIKSKYILHFNPDAMINDDVIYEMYRLSKKIDFAIISAVETNGETHIKSSEIDKLKEVESVKGFVMFINNFECKDSNYFDENFFLYLEEIDLCKRLKEKNKKIFLAENIVVKHLGGKSHNPKHQEKMEIQRNWHYLWSLFYFSKKHKNIFYAYKITLRKFISAFFKLIFYYFISKKKYNIYKHRFLGLLNSYLGKKSFFRID
jgi:N-acetylglucosaminyl-diphospho-decaprenol L-rhamnosyltransferase